METCNIINFLVKLSTWLLKRVDWLSPYLLSQTDVRISNDPILTDLESFKSEFMDLIILMWDLYLHESNICGPNKISCSVYLNFCISRQVRLFDSRHYLKAFGAGDVWVAVGWSNDVLPAAKRMSNIAVVVPKSGASLWADFWVCTELSPYTYILMFRLTFYILLPLNQFC